MNMPELFNEVKRLLDAGAANSAWTLLVAHAEADVPTNANSCLFGCLALQRMGQLNEAWNRIEMWLSANAQNATNPYVLRMAGFLLEQLGRQDAGLAVFRTGADHFVRC